MQTFCSCITKNEVYARTTYTVHDFNEFSCVGHNRLDGLKLLEKGIVLAVYLVDLVFARHIVQTRRSSRSLHVPGNVKGTSFSIALVRTLMI